MVRKTVNPGGTQAAAKIYMLLGASALAFFVVVIGLMVTKRGSPTSASQADASAANAPAEPVVSTAENTSSKPAAPRPAMPKPAPRVAASAPGVAVLGPQPTAQTRQLIENLTKLDSAAGSLTPEQVTAWKQNFQELLQQGAASVPAIREFLGKNVDLDFGAGGKSTFGYGTVRGAMFDALGQIGGTEAIATLTGALSTTADPREIALLAKNLDKLEPGQHRADVLAAANEALAMAGDGRLTDRDVAPVFEVLQKYGDASTAAELSKTSRNWNYYAMIALAQLPEGAGIPSLVQIVEGQDPAASGSRAAALQMLAQASGGSDAAKTALLDQVKQNKLTAYNWATLGPILAGDQLHFQDSAFDENRGNLGPGEVQSSHISSGNQNFFTAPTPESMTAEKLNQQAALIDQLIAATQDANALQTLERSKAIVSRRLAQVSVTQNK